MTTVGEAIKEARKRRGLVQKDVAKAVGVSVAAVGQWERSDNALTMENLRAVCGFLKIDPVSAHRGEVRYLEESPDLNEVEQVTDPGPVAFGPRDVPVEGVGIGGDGADFEFIGDVIDYARRPPGIAAVRNVFAIHVLGDSMSPRFEVGDLAYCGGRHAVPGDDVVIELQGEPGGSRRGYVKRLVQRTAKELIVRQFNPAIELRFPMKEVKAIHRVIPFKELLGF
ncbi:XRE family transcriptional regulator [Aureimonas phyllosphaerae]|nr:XRE family transcriptional regulator [Aureimonas phyllosphaerae]SFF45289.1 transcriptional regulator [Aureimonas phyllosphaerae]